ncbi:MAG: hypothetical protein AAFU65_03920, partial [Pseudomonadota bacterium]
MANAPTTDQSDTESGSGDVAPDVSLASEAQRYERFRRTLAAHGYGESTSDYAVLRDSELLELVDSGDVAAIQYRAAKLKLHDPDSARELFLTAAAYGSSAALVQIAATNMFHIGAAVETSDGPDSTESAVTEAYAFVLAASARGNNAGAKDKLTQIEASIC